MLSQWFKKRSIDLLFKPLSLSLSLSLNPVMSLFSIQSAESRLCSSPGPHLQMECAVCTQTWETDKSWDEGGQVSKPSHPPPEGMAKANRTLGDRPRVHDMVFRLPYPLCLLLHSSVFSYELSHNKHLLKFAAPILTNIDQGHWPSVKLFVIRIWHCNWC